MNDDSTRTWHIASVAIRVVGCAMAVASVVIFDATSTARFALGFTGFATMLVGHVVRDWSKPLTEDLGRPDGRVNSPPKDA